jgi:hypothetical protein
MLLSLQLVFDCQDPDEMMRFWGRSLGYNNEFAAMTPEELTEWRKGFPQFDGRGRVDDQDFRRMPIYIQKVPEPKPGRNRLRLEIGVPRRDTFVEEIRAVGATQLEDGFADVEGNEFTIREGAAEARLECIEVDALDPQSLVDFWSAATGYVVTDSRCDPPPGAKYVLPFSDGEPRELDLIPGLRFVQASEPKRTKNRLHLDLHVTDPDTLRDDLVSRGATVWRWDDEHVLTDPEGNELCLN